MCATKFSCFLPERTTSFQISFGCSDSTDIYAPCKSSGARTRTEISRLSVATGYKPAVLPLNYTTFVWRPRKDSNFHLRFQKNLALAFKLRGQIHPNEVRIIHRHRGCRQSLVSSAWAFSQVCIPVAGVATQFLSHSNDPHFVRMLAYLCPVSYRLKSA